MTVITQEQMFYQSQRKLADRDNQIMEMIRDPVNPLTRDDLHRLADRCPHRYERYRKLLDNPPKRFNCHGDVPGAQ